MSEPITIAAVIELLGKVTEYLRDRSQARDRDFSDWLQNNNYNKLRNLLLENKQLSSEVDDVIRGNSKILDAIQRDVKMLLEIVQRNDGPYIWEPTKQEWMDKTVGAGTGYYAHLPASTHNKGAFP